MGVSRRVRYARRHDPLVRPRSQWATGLRRVPRNKGSNVSLIATLTPEGISSAITIEGSLDTLAFDAYVEHFLLPPLKPGQTVVMDNLKVHYSPTAKRLIEAARCRQLHLPIYSPHSNPIEGTFSKLKTLVRQAKARSRELLDSAIASALQAISPNDARAFFSRAGYLLPGQSL